MKKHFSRRDFLLKATAGVGGLAGTLLLQACGQAKTAIPTLPPTAQPLSQLKPTDTPFQAATVTTAPTAGAQATVVPTAQPTPSIPDLVVARNGKPEEMVQRALAALGGIEKFIQAGDTVIVKPNICVAYHTYEYAATTNPWVVGELVRQCLGAGAKEVQVVDFPFGGTVDEAYVKSGIRAEVEAAGGKMIYIPGYKYIKAKIPEGKDLKDLYIFDDVLKTKLINVPIAKHHSLARLTIGMKNLLGIVRDRQKMHFNIGQRLADIASLVRPVLTVVDAVRILTANGPTGGNLADVKQLNTVIASADFVAADAYATTLFGMKPDEMEYVRAAAAMGLGRSDLSALKIQEIAVGA